MRPNVPIVWDSTLSLSSITVPPTPLLNSPFISDGTSTAIWNSQLIPLPRCKNEERAKNFDCELVDKCSCYPAETQANCHCKDLNISAWMSDLRHNLPLLFSSLSFRRNEDGQVMAFIPSMTTAEIILTVQDHFNTYVIFDDTFCAIKNTTLTGCYKCAKGAQTLVICASSRRT
ncbi:hypothetical protein Y032_0094g2689 [Ancylostoma ceylanicum]|uniref:Phlebovirus glycoprotein G2 fusion domain-containing protein n=1 Tax=Ancylostoma ceylanicum TaxID=53326 RepID=A0A016TKS6_9BILA|nr:hypothetical protein Y032_0094g2689 [Ancylostoma ceylanicum]